MEHLDVDDALHEADASLAIEGIAITAFSEDQAALIRAGAITIEEALEELHERHPALDEP